MIHQLDIHQPWPLDSNSVIFAINHSTKIIHKIDHLLVLLN